ncbi:hypothetical protein C1646_772402 [Rhizophagus diaphanus]|nr:hypothetical protein C1646_772402 [Rhizophagus diaphanus] [Rhizophagus sp. MUCL 43196]
MFSIIDMIRFQHNVKNWTSGTNNDIDKFIQDVQLSEHTYHGVSNVVLEWIPYERFYDIDPVDEFDEVYTVGIDGFIYG